MPSANYERVRLHEDTMLRLLTHKSPRIGTTGSSLKMASKLPVVIRLLR
jgi:hypothetical protein